MAQNLFNEIGLNLDFEKTKIINIKQENSLGSRFVAVVESRRVAGCVCLVKERMEALKKMVEDMRAEMREGFSKVDSAKNRFLDIETALASVISRVEMLEGKLDYLENQPRRNNIVIHGLPDEERETWEQSEDMVRRVVAQLGIELREWDIERAHRVGRSWNRKRPIVCKLANYKLKVMILQDAKYLRRSGVYISEDFSERVRRETEFLKRHMFETRRQGCHAVIQYKLVVNGRLWSRVEMEALDSLKEDGAKSGERNIEDTVVASEERNPGSENNGKKSSPTVSAGNASKANTADRKREEKHPSGSPKNGATKATTLERGRGEKKPQTSLQTRMDKLPSTNPRDGASMATASERWRGERGQQPAEERADVTPLRT
ncbi:hypothetical protein ANN_13757 [Periplaneta americana]|uniref:Endonuclease-reverse transcriptase n=1 Tax=Periplaneta americana TaxID=6978 RepID=A0ABQ8SUF4_PERAM|nr:hypothetical protein ANN_13757 [Periplaneta americana]